MINSLYKNYMKENEKQLKRVYYSMADQKSRDIYNDLLCFHATGDYNHMIHAIARNGYQADRQFSRHQKLLSLCEKEKRPLILYGIGEVTKAHFEMAKSKKNSIGYLYVPFITEIPWAAYCDKNQVLWGTEFGQGDFKRNIISPKEMANLYPNAFICVTSAEFFQDIKVDLMKLGYSKDSIFLYTIGGTQVFEEAQYFDSEILKPQRESLFIDGGCYRLDTVERFCRWNHPYGFDGFISFEPDPVNYKICQEHFNKLPIDEVIKRNSCIVQAGLSNLEERKFFASSGNDESHFDEQGDASVQLTTIDKNVQGRPVSFIKLDVEGFELQALNGGIETITHCRPRMAVCAYHKRTDLINIPKFILDLNMGYQLYLRIYSNTYLEIVIYAI